MRPILVSLAVEPSVLTPRERQVLIGLAKGGTNHEVAADLLPSLSVKTIDTHRGHILKKLQLRNNSDLTRYAIRHALIDVDGGDIEIEGIELPAPRGHSAPIAQPRPITQAVMKAALGIE